MLTIIVGGEPVFNDDTQEFTLRGGYELELEHSLASLSKWESEFEKPFISKDEKTPEEILAYVRHMSLKKVPEEIYHRLSKENVQEILEYMNAKMSATWFEERPGRPPNREIITSEVLYYWMTAFNIPFECETWHLNRLFTLIRVCNEKNAKPETMSRAAVAARNRELNAQRRAQLGTKG